MADAVAIVSKPTSAVKSLSTPTRESGGSYKMKSKLNLGKSLVSKKSKKRATQLNYGWSLGVSLPTGKSTKWSKTINISSSTTEYTPSINLNSFNGHTRASFYPLTNAKLTSVSIWAQPKNVYSAGPKKTQTRNFTVPAVPVIGDFSVNDQTGVVSCTITSDAGQEYAERYRTRYKVVIQNTRTGKTWTHEDSNFTALTKTVSYDASDYQQLTYGQYIRITVSAWNQGFAGDSTTVSKQYTVSYPAQTTIKSVGVSSRSATGKCTVLISTNSSANNPVDAVKLEYLANTTYADAASIPGDTSFTDSGIVDNARCTALAMPVANLIPDPGKYTWVRVRSEHAIENVLYRYSEPQRVKGLETPAPTAADDNIKILSTSLGVDGESVVVHMGWNVGGTDDSTGTELSWADADDAWRSTEPPDTFEFTWSDGSYTDTSVTPNVTYQDSATITIKGLDAGQNVYIRARRYLDLNGERSYGDYCNTKTNIPSSAAAAEPESVALSLPGFVARGSSALAAWALSSPSEQESWQIVTVTATVDDDEIVYTRDLVVSEGTGITNNYQIPPERLEELAVDDVLLLRLEVSTGGDPIVSDVKSLTIVDAPTVTVSALSTLTAQPLSFTLTSNVAARIIATITASGVGGQSPSGIVEQHAGDTVWAADIVPAWTIVDDDEYTATITLDAGKAFYDGVGYAIEVQAIDTDTGLKSATASDEFVVDWAHQAVAPEGCIVKPSSYTDNDGVPHITAEITVVAPDGSTPTDVYDIYRYTADGAALIGSGYASGDVLVDEYTPFGAGMDLYYRVATRTADGDTEFADIIYWLDVRTLRFDWPYGYLELPYNIEISDAYAKNVAFRNHLDGSYDGYWNEGVKRTARHSSQIIRLESQTDIAAARQLARYPGSVFVRTPDGSAFEADVQINEMSTSGVIQLFSLSITEITPTGTYDLPPLEEE